MPDNKVMVETVRSIEAPLEANESAAEAALAYTMGLSWKSSVAPKDETLPFEPYNGDLDKLVSMRTSSIRIGRRSSAGLRALEGQQQTAATLSIFVAVMIPEQECDLRTGAGIEGQRCCRCAAW